MVSGINRHAMLKTSLLAALALAVCSVAAQAAVVSVNGDTTTSPFYNRTTVTGTLSAYSVHYAALPFTVTTSGAYDFALIATVPPEFFDTFLHLYQGGFNPADAETNFLAANDDRVFGSPQFGSALTAVPLVAGTPYILVADGFLPADYGSFNATASGPGNILFNAVPEPASFVPVALAALGGGFFLARRRCRAAAAR